MTISLPIAVVNRIATGCVANQGMKADMGDTLQLSFLSLLPTPAHGSRFGMLQAGFIGSSFALPGERLPIAATRSTRQSTWDRDAWRHDGREMLARYQPMNVMTSQENLKPKSKASA